MVVPRVCILSFCRSEEFLMGNLLVFETLRVGFPTARIELWDNASDPDCYEKIRKAATAAGCETMPPFEKRVEHADWLERMTKEAQPDEPLVFLDPDVVFWKSVEDWKFPEGTLIAGRYIPRYRLFAEAVSDERLHTSLLWIMRPGEIEKLRRGKEYLFDFRPFHGAIFRDGKNFRHLDTGSALFSVVKDRAYRFTEADLDCYDHVWSGSAMDYNEETVRPEALALMRESHATARKDPSKLKGLWKYQEALFKRYAEEGESEAVPAVYSKPSEAEMHIRWAQDDKGAAALIDYFGYATQLADDLVDMDREGTKTLTGRSRIMAELLYVLLVKIPGNPFFRKHEMHFIPLFTNCLVQWDASNTWSESEKKESRIFAYVQREAAGRLVEQVAYLVGGFQWAKEVVREIHEYYHATYMVESFDQFEAECKEKR